MAKSGDKNKSATERIREEVERESDAPQAAAAPPQAPPAPAPPTTATDKIRGEVKAARNPATTTGGKGEGASKRQRAGTTHRSEPTLMQIAEAATNAPSQDFVIHVGDTEYPVVELTMAESLRFMAILQTAIEAVSMSLLPALKIGLKLWSLRSLPEAKREELRVVAMTEDRQLLQQALELYGIEEATEDQLTMLIAMSTDGRAFMIEVGKIFLEPLILSLKGNFSLAKILEECEEHIPELIKMCLLSSLKRRKLTVVVETVEADIQMLDFFDGIEIIYQQFAHYQQRGKLQRFTSLSGKLFPLRTDGATPTA